MQAGRPARLPSSNNRQAALAQKFPWAIFGEEVADQAYQRLLVTLVSNETWYERNRTGLAADAAYAALRDRLQQKIGDALALPVTLGDYQWAQGFKAPFRDALDQVLAKARRPYLAYLQRVTEAVNDLAPAKDPALRTLALDEVETGRLRAPLEAEASASEALALVIAVAPINAQEDRVPLLLLPVAIEGSARLKPGADGSARLFTSRWLPDQNSPVYIDPDALLGADAVRWSGETWPEAWSGLSDWWESVTGVKVGEAGDWLDRSRSLTFDLIKAPNTDSSIAEAYRKASGMERLPGLLPLVVGDGHVAPKSKPVPVDLAAEERDASDHLGHMDEDDDGRRQGFALDASQRLATWYAAALGGGDPTAPRIIAVNGPPGTGKTSFLRSVLSSYWVRDAIDGKPSPRWVVATGATNKAVSNVIEAFGKVAGKVPGAVATRWIPGLPSYGWFLASSQRVAEARKKGNAPQPIPTRDLMVLHRHKEHPYQENPPKWPEDEVRDTIWAADFAAAPFQIQFEESLDGIVASWCANANLCFDKPDLTLDQGVEILRKKLKEKHDELIADRRRLTAVLWKAFESVGENKRTMVRSPELSPGRVLGAKRETERQAELARQADREAQELEDVVRTGRAYHAARSEQRSFEASWFSWFRRKRRAILAEAVHVAEVAYLAAIKGTAAESRSTVNGTTVYDHDHVSGLLERTKATANAAIIEYNRAMRTERMLHEDVQRRRKLIVKLSEGLKEDLKPSALRTLVRRGWKDDDPKPRFEHAIESILDKKHRFELFHLAARYWEGRWLQDRLKDRETGKAKSLAKEFNPSEWMKLGVIMVGTLPRLSNLAKEFNQTIDVLIVDEAGQATVDGGVWLLGHARSALLLGDTHQLEPIYPLPKREDERHMRLAGLQPVDVPDEMATHAGSMMAIAQRYTGVTDSDTPPGANQPPGIMLRTHYRCAPVIAEFCNQLRYEGRMKMARGKDPEGFPLKRMAWVDVQGNAERVGTSWENEAEAEAIIRWLAAKGAELCKTVGKGKPIDEVIAVISPMAAQARLLSNRLRHALAPHFGADVMGRMIIGTVHRLQGAERPIVAMSLAQTMAPLFADRDGGKLMNVAVSRAKEQFILFGNNSVTRVVPGSPEPLGGEPTAKLSRYLRAHGHRLFPDRILFVPHGSDVRRLQAEKGVDTRVVQLDPEPPAEGQSPRWLEVVKRYPGISVFEFDEGVDPSEVHRII